LTTIIWMAPQSICPTSAGWAKGQKEWAMRSVKKVFTWRNGGDV
jgi:hypothetical protein